MPGTYVKINGVYRPVEKIFSKLNGAYEEIDLGFYKYFDPFAGPNYYGEVFNNTGGSGTNPQDDLDSITIINDTISNNIVSEETDANIWGNGNNLDSNSISIGDFGGGDQPKLWSYCVKLPSYIPLLNVDNIWLSTKGIAISGSTASISRKQITKNTGSLLGLNSSLNRPDAAVADLVIQDVYDNLKTTLTSNRITLESDERQTNNSYLTFSTNRIPVYKSDAIDITRITGGVKTGHRAFGGGTNESGYAHWRIEVDVNYNLTFFHAASGLSRTIQKTVKFRTYN